MPARNNAPASPQKALRAWRHAIICRALRRDRAGNARPYAHLRVSGFRQQTVACRMQRVENAWCLRNDVGESIALPVGFRCPQGPMRPHRLKPRTVAAAPHLTPRCTTGAGGAATPRPRSRYYPSCKEIPYSPVNPNRKAVRQSGAGSNPNRAAARWLQAKCQRQTMREAKPGACFLRHLQPNTVA